MSLLGNLMVGRKVSRGGGLSSNGEIWWNLIYPALAVPLTSLTVAQHVKERKCQITLPKLGAHMNRESGTIIEIELLRPIGLKLSLSDMFRPQGAFIV